MRTSLTCTPLQHSHIFPCPAYIYFKEKAHVFCFHLAYVATCKNQLITKKTLEAPTQVGSSVKKHTTNFGRQCFDCSSKHQEQSLSGSCHFQSCVASATVCQSTHSRTDTHNQQLPKILTAQISTPTLEEVKGRAD